MNNLDVLILHMPHSGTEIPDKTGYVVPDEVLCAEANLIKDWGVEEIFGIEGVDRLKPVFSRLFCDVERFRQDEEEPLAEKGFGFAYTRCQDGSVMRELSKDDKDRIAKKYYDPHHRDFERLTDKKLQEFGFVFIVDCHTFPAVPIAWEEPSEEPRPDICIGTCMAMSPQNIRKYTIKYFEEKGYSVGWNYPYTGTIMPDKYFRLANDRVKGMMIEINRRLFFDEQTMQMDADALKRLRGEIKELLETISTMEVERQKCRDNPDVYLVMENEDA